MTIVKAKSIQQAYELLNSGRHQAIELDFEIDSDAFFSLSDEFGDRGAKISKHDDHFVVKLKKIDIPAT
nr:hypothetical protein [uncultured Enterobacter sp.]